MGKSKERKTKNQNEKMHVELFVDGACSGNPGPGAWAAIVRIDGRKREISGSGRSATNNQMELTAAIMGLESLKEPRRITIYSESDYVVDGASKHLELWKNNRWRKANKRPVKNVKLWRRLDAASQGHDIIWAPRDRHERYARREQVYRLARHALKKQGAS